MLRLSYIQRFSLHDGPGIRTTVFLKGCTLGCLWCHNPETISALPSLQYFRSNCIACGRCAGVCPRGAVGMDGGFPTINREECDVCGLCTGVCPSGALSVNGEDIEAESLFATVARDRSFYESSGGGVTVSGGEPLAQAEGAAELLKMCRDAGIHTAVDTAGCVDFRCFERVLSHTDLFLYDLKIMDPEKHRRYTGQSNDLILANFIKLTETGKDIVIRVPVIPGVNDGEDEKARLEEFLGLLPRRPQVERLPMHTMGKGKYASLGIENEFYI